MNRGYVKCFREESDKLRAVPAQSRGRWSGMGWEGLGATSRERIQETVDRTLQRPGSGPTGPARKQRWRGGSSAKQDSCSRCSQWYPQGLAPCPHLPDAPQMCEMDGLPHEDYSSSSQTHPSVHLRRQIPQTLSPSSPSSLTWPWTSVGSGDGVRTRGPQAG